MSDERDLVITRLIAASHAAVYRCWSDPALMVRWFELGQFKAVRADLDVRPGGASMVVMRAPGGEEFANCDTYLEVVPGERLVFTDAYTSGWEPSDKPFMTVVVTFADEAGQTRFTLRFRHWTAEDRDAHAAMDFDARWEAAIDALAALAATV